MEKRNYKSHPFIKPVLKSDRGWSTLGIFFVLCLGGLFATALEPKGPLALSMSGSGRAITKGAEYHLLNPASLIHFKGAQGSGFWTFGLEKQKSYWGVSIVENQKIPLGLSYIREWGSKTQYLSFSTAAFILPGWSMGLSLSRWQAEPLGRVSPAPMAEPTSQVEISKKSQSANKALSSDLPDSKDDKAEASWNVQAGLLIKPAGSPFSIGAVYDHILPLKGAFKGQRKWALGMGFALYEWLSLRADALYNTNSQWAVAGGAEATVSKFLILRLANQWDFKDKNWLFSGGLGLTAKNMALDYGLSRTAGTKRWQNTLSVRFAF